MTFSRDTYWKILRKQLTLLGVWNSSFSDEGDDWNYVLRRIYDRKVDVKKLISHRFAIDDLEQGFLIMKNKTEDYCKVMMVME